MLGFSSTAETTEKEWDVKNDEKFIENKINRTNTATNKRRRKPNKTKKKKKKEKSELILFLCTWITYTQDTTQIYIEI